MALLDVAIGLTFLFVLLGLFITVFQELAASVLTSRAKNLMLLIENLLDGKTSQLFQDFLKHPLLRQICTNEPGTQIGLIFQRWRISFPSYLSASRFAAIVIDLVEPTTAAGEHKPISEAAKPIDAFRRAVERLEPKDGAFRQSLLAVLNGLAPGKSTPQEQLDALRAAIGKWYDDCTARAAGWYKRRAQTFVFVYALLLAIALSVDTIHVGRTLYDNPVLAKAIADQAEAYVEEVKANEIASNYLLMGSGFADTLLTIAGMDAATWDDEQLVAQALDGVHLRNLQFVHEQTMDEGSVDPTVPADCSPLTDASDRSLRLACLIRVIEHHAPAEGEAAGETEPEDGTEAAGGTEAEGGTEADQEDAWLLADKGVYADAISESLTILRTRSGLVTLDALTGELEEAGFPIGWDQLCARFDAADGGDWLWVLLQTIFGILLTALAASLGAPFLFDLLNKFVNLRGSGLVPVRGATSLAVTSTEAAPDGQDARQPAG